MDTMKVFHSDLQEIFGMLKYKNKKTELMKYIKDREEYFRNVDMDTYHVIREFLHSEKVLKTIDEGEREETVDMCKALQDLYDEGIEVGIEKGMALEKLDIAKKLLDILTLETVAEKVRLPLEEILKLKDE